MTMRHFYEDGGHLHSEGCRQAPPSDSRRVYKDARDCTLHLTNTRLARSDDECRPRDTELSTDRAKDDETAR